MAFRDFLRYTVLAVLFVVPFIPLYVASGMFFPFITGKGFLFRILIEIGFVAWVLLALLDVRYRPRFSWTLALYAGFIGWMAIANAFAINSHKAFWSNFERMDGWVTLIHVFAFFLIAGAVLTVHNRWRTWWLVFLSASAIVSAYGLLQLWGVLAIHQSGVRLDASFGNSAYFAVYLLFALAASVWQALESKGWLRYALIALAALQVLLIIQTATRGAILGLVGAAGFGALLWMVGSGVRGRLVAGVLLVVVVLGSLGFYAARDAAFIQESPVLSRVASISAKDLEVRFTLWGMALEGVKERPLVGYGQEGFNYIFNKYYEPSLYKQEPWFDRAHNVFLDWLTAGGIPALLLFLSTLLAAVWALFRRGASKAERVLLTSALVAYGIQGLVVFDNLFSYVPLAAVLACAHAVSSRPIKKLETLPVLTDETSKIMAGTAGAVIAVLLVWSVNVPNMQAAASLVEAISVRGTTLQTNRALFEEAIATNTFGLQEVREQLIMFTSSVVNQPNIPMEEKNAWVEFGFTQLQEELKKAPEDARLHMQLALGYRAIGQNELAIKESTLAHELSPRKQSILIERGYGYLQLGNRAEARASFEEAYALDPSFDELAAFAAAGAILTGDIDEGKQLLIERLGTTTVDSDALVLAYYETKQWSDLIAVMRSRLLNRPGDLGALSGLVAALAESGRVGEARAVAEAFLRDYPTSAAQVRPLLDQLSGM